MGEGLSDGWIGYSGYFGALTDNNYSSIPGSPIGGGPWTQNSPVSLADNYHGSSLAHVNQDDGNPLDTTASAAYNACNIRFRHDGNTTANALMVDGHVQSFVFNPHYNTSSLLCKNLFVNR